MSWHLVDTATKHSLTFTSTVLRAGSECIEFHHCIRKSATKGIKANDGLNASIHGRDTDRNCEHMSYTIGLYQKNQDS